MNQPKFPNWEQLYQTEKVESMPWFNQELDPDLGQALARLNIHSGSVLDLGTGPGTQAIALAKLGFTVTATDLSAAAIKQAQAKALDQGLEISFFQDDILNSKIDQTFDLIFDRGCFHVLPPSSRQDYVQVVDKLVKPQGYFFLKCFSSLQPGEQGPYRFSKAQIEEIFSQKFKVNAITDTIYHQGTLDPPPQALFCILVKA